LYSFTFGADGGYPIAGLTYAGGYLYGATIYGGNTACAILTGIGCGTIFKVNASTGAETTLYTFSGGADGASARATLLYSGGNLYGATEFGGVSLGGTVFKVNATTGALQTLQAFGAGSAGNTPLSALLHVGKLLYGATTFGGSFNTGTVFSLVP
jgi:uncharacterized repeat protein (TIGR03803 family)